MLADEAGRPRVLQLSPGQPSDIVAAHDLIVTSQPIVRRLADRPTTATPYVGCGWSAARPR